ncbi:NAD(P)-binding protein [Daedalea quercina L-15889]|uniref:NAD(P)-binding protein n=1 Tax=Daedalea quercina L-15889 TaxID=1314783 RepID=A0A165TFL8_9APHY|nr:NAD(P)-binding protein [Daedalea quercina L-15889]
MSSEPVFRVALRGELILTNPRWNKGSAFTTAERKAFGLTGRLPYRVNTLDEQCQRAYDQLQSRETPLRKNTFLQSLKDQSWVLYYALISRHVQELTPIIYTPTEAEAISKHSHLFQRSEGLYLSFPYQDAMEEDFLEQARERDVDLIVCSDAEMILGIGDQGVGHQYTRTPISSSLLPIVIPSQTSLLAGVDPSRTLSVTLDVGTDNQKLLTDPLYVLLRKHFPSSLLHFEDFGANNAKRLLDTYAKKHTVFNDDVFAASAKSLIPPSPLTDEQTRDRCGLVIFGAGTAGLGIARQVRDAMVTLDGLSTSDANKRFWLLDRYGLVKASLGPDKIRASLCDFTRMDKEWEGVEANERGEVGLLEVVRRVKPTVLIGCSTIGGAFDEAVVRAMAKGAERPIILPLSNSTSKHECKPEDAKRWSDGKALLAAGSPFPPCEMSNGKKYMVAECNSEYALIYPGLGFGAILSKTRSVTDGMIVAGARRLASLAPALKRPDNALLPDFGDSPEVDYEVTCSVVEQAIEEGVAGTEWKKEEAREKVKERQWKPIYWRYKYDPDGEQ